MLFGSQRALPLTVKNLLIAPGGPTPATRDASLMVSLAMHAPPRGRETSTKVYLGLPSRKISGKRPVDDGRIAFPGTVRLALHGVNITLLDMVGLPGQLTVRGIILLG